MVRGANGDDSAGRVLGLGTDVAFNFDHRQTLKGLRHTSHLQTMGDRARNVQAQLASANAGINSWEL